MEWDGVKRRRNGRNISKEALIQMGNKNHKKAAIVCAPAQHDILAEAPLLAQRTLEAAEIAALHDADRLCVDCLYRQSRSPADQRLVCREDRWRD